MLKIAKNVLREGNICNNCLGRQYAKILSGYSNEQRGRAIRLALEKHKGAFTQDDFKKYLKSKEEVKTKGECWVCNNIFKKKDKIAKKAINEVKNMDFKTFHVGIRLNQELLNNEEKLWEKVGIESTEPIKTELNREIGKIIGESLKKKVDFEHPDLVILVNLKEDSIELSVRSLFIYGKYKKFAKIPQTKWTCMNCRGLGCKKCDFKGKLYRTSVEEEIAKVLLRKTRGINTKFSGAGREDRDVKCLDWREFVIEIQNPEIRKINLKSTEEKINKSKKIKVSSLKFTDKEKVKKVKEERKNKTYRIKVRVKKPIERKDIKKISKLKGIIKQKTPTRVSKRRAQITRKREVIDIKAKLINSRNLEIIVKTEAGLYIKELITGDENKTIPSLSQLLNNQAEVKELEVIKIS